MSLMFFLLLFLLIYQISPATCISSMDRLSCVPLLHHSNTVPHSWGNETVSSPFTAFICLLQLINAGKGEALRIRAILRSLVPTTDLVGIISIPLKMPMVNKGIGIFLLHHGSHAVGRSKQIINKDMF